jgi:hypothetical protein
MDTAMAQWRTTFTLRSCIWLLIFCVAAPFVYAIIQGYWALLMPRWLLPLGIHSREVVFVAIALFNVIGAMFTAVVLACPLAILVHTQSVALGVALGLITVATLLVFVPINEMSEWTSWISVIEYSAFVLFCALASHLTARAMERARV